MSDNRGAMLASMYQDEEDDEVLPADPIVTSPISRRIRVGAIAYDVPTVEHVARLEQTLADHARIINQQQQIIDQLRTEMAKNARLQGRSGSALNDLKRKLKLYDY